MKLCPTCGTVMDDNAVFCPVCGSAVANPTPAQPPMPPYSPPPAPYSPPPAPYSPPLIPAVRSEEPPTLIEKPIQPTTIKTESGVFYSNAAVHDYKKWLIIGGIVLALIALIVAIVLFILSAGPKATVEKMFDSLNARDTETLINITCPEHLSEKFNLNPYTLTTYAKNSINDLSERIGVDFTIEHTNLKIRNMKSRDFKNLKKDLKERYDLEITDAKEVNFRYNITGFKNREKGSDSFILYKYDKKWYVYSAEDVERLVFGD